MLSESDKALRDLFAGLAMTKLITRERADYEDVADWAYQMADVMMAERAKRPTKEG